MGMGNVIMPTPGGAFNSFLGAGQLQGAFGGFPAAAAAASDTPNPVAAATTADGDSSAAAAAPTATPAAEEMDV
jgi:hypothetical protein